MASKTAPKTVPKPAPRQPGRQAITLELVRALYAAAQGAAYAYAQVTGEEWKPYEGMQPTGTIQQRSTTAMMDALAD